MSDPAEEEMKRPRTEEEKQLETECRLLKDRYSREKRLLVEFEQAGKRTESFWHMEKKKLESSKMDLRNKLRQKQDLQDKHDYEKKRYGEKVYHLFHEQFANVTDVKTEAEVMMTSKLRDFMVENDTDNVDRRALLIRQKEMQQKHMEVLNSLRREQEERIMQMRQKYELLSENLRLEYDEKARVMRSSASTSRKHEITSLQEQKAQHIAALMEAHSKELADIRNYYGDITRSNLDLIKTLKGEVQELQKAERTKEHGMLEVARANDQLKEPFQQHLDTITTMKTQVADHTRDKADLKHTKGELDELISKYETLSWQNGIQIERYEKACDERKQLEGMRTRSVYEVTQKADLQAQVLEAKVAALQSEIDREDALLAMSADLVGGGPRPASRGLREIMRSKNGKSEKLQADLAEAMERYHATIGHFESVMELHVISVDDVGTLPRLPTQG